MIKYNFDAVPNRHNTGNLKWDFLPDFAKNAIPMSVADVDFVAPQEVVDALAERAKQGFYGYTMMANADIAAVQSWLARRHHQMVPKEWLLPTSGVVCTMRAAMFVLTNEGDKVVFQPPIHTPCFSTASRYGRQMVENRLIFDSKKYRMNFAELEKFFREGARLLLICNPHNPVGRAWSREELSELAALCNRYNVRIISDETHNDVLRRENVFMPMASIEGMEEKVITLFSPAKTFNLGGFQIGTAIIADDELHKKISARLYDVGHYCGRPTMMSIVAQTAAYQYGEPWLEQMIDYLDSNMDMALKTFAGTPLSVYRPEATYLLWADCSKLGMQTDELMNLMVNKAGVYPDLGHLYFCNDLEYKGSETHIRFNLGLPKPLLKKALDGIREATLNAIK